MQDPVDEALDALRDRTWHGDGTSKELRGELMKKIEENASRTGFSRRGMTVAVLALCALGTAGFAAAGGVDLIRGLFVTVEVNGEVVDIDEGDITVETQGDTTTVTIDVGELSDDIEEGVAHITVDSTVDQAVMTVGSYGADGSDEPVEAETLVVTVQTSDHDTERAQDESQEEDK